MNSYEAGNEVCSIEYAKKLEELMIAQNSDFLWIEIPSVYSLKKWIMDTKIILINHNEFLGSDFNSMYVLESWGAPSAIELICLLPVFFKDNSDYFKLKTQKFKDKSIEYYAVNYISNSSSLFENDFYNTNLADCLAELIFEMVYYYPHILSKLKTKGYEDRAFRID